MMHFSLLRSPIAALYRQVINRCRCFMWNFALPSPCLTFFMYMIFIDYFPRLVTKTQGPDDSGEL